MLAIVGFATILVLLAAIMAKKLSTMSALIAIPIIACLAIGEGSSLSKYMLVLYKCREKYLCTYFFDMMRVIG